MAVLLNIPAFNINPDNLTSDDIKYQNPEKPQLTTITDAIGDLFGSKVDKVPGKGLSSNDFTDEYKQRLDDLTGQIVFSTFAEFPVIGQVDKLYIDKTNNVSYLWNPQQQIYISVTFEDNQYQIQCSL